MRTAVLTISTSVARRETEDEAGPLLAALAEEAGADVEAMEVVPDDFGLIEDRLHHFVDDGVRLIFTTGGTGPDARRRHARGHARRDRARRARVRRGDARARALRHTPMGMLARGVSRHRRAAR